MWAVHNKYIDLVENQTAMSWILPCYRWQIIQWETTLFPNEKNEPIIYL